MAEATGGKPTTIPKLGFESDLLGHKQSPSSGTRVLVGTGEYDNSPTAFERGRVGARDYYQQRFQPGASSPLWRGYAIDTDKNVTGVLLRKDDIDILLWTSPAKRLVASAVSELVDKKYPQAQILGRFHLTGKHFPEDVPELVLESGSESFDGRMGDLVDYFGISLNWEERIVKLKVSRANGQQHFAGSLQEYLMLDKP